MSFTMMGTFHNVAGEGITLESCDDCGAVVPYLRAMRHRQFHEATEGKTVPAEDTAIVVTEAQLQAVSQTDIRTWAAEHGIDVAPQGRIANGVVDAYWAAHGGKTA